MKPDILDFFTYKNTFGFGYKVVNRIFGIQALLKGNLSLKDTISFILPGRMSTNRKEIWERMFSKYINEDGSVNLYGKKFIIPFNNYGDFAVLVQQIIIDDQYKIKRFLGKNFHVIDGGANMGVFSVFVAKEYPDATIYAFEPAMETFHALKENNSYYPNVQVFSLGLGEEKATRDFQVYKDSSTSNHFVSPEFSTNTETVQAFITTLDDFVKENHIDHVDFIKLDTEGYEANILRGGTETIKKDKPVIVMSAYHKPNDKKELPELLHSICSDYHCEMHSDNEEDLVCYVNKPLVK